VNRGSINGMLPLNRRFGEACTDWPVRPTPADPMSLNDHTDWRWDGPVLHTLATVQQSFNRLCDDLSGCLARFDAYADLYASALGKAATGEHAWVDAPDRDSCHLVWMQFHEGPARHPGHTPRLGLLTPAGARGG
jgi:hypothetical protein